MFLGSKTQRLWIWLNWNLVLDSDAHGHFSPPSPIHSVLFPHSSNHVYKPHKMIDGKRVKKLTPKQSKRLIFFDCVHRRGTWFLSLCSCLWNENFRTVTSNYKGDSTHMQLPPRHTLKTLSWELKSIWYHSPLCWLPFCQTHLFFPQPSLANERPHK